MLHHFGSLCSGLHAQLLSQLLLRGDVLTHHPLHFGGCLFFFFL